MTNSRPFGRRRVALVVALLAIGLALHLLARRNDRTGIERRPPDVLLVVLDTVGANSVSLYGNPRGTTPRLDAFARDAVVFERAYSVAPWTTPSHASMFTGRYPLQHGATQEHKFLDERELTLAELLRARGYATAGIVGNPNAGADRGLAQGFETFLDLWRHPELRDAPGSAPRDAGANAITRAAKAWVEAQGERPWMLFLNFLEAHRPYSPPDERAPDSIACDEVRKYDYPAFLAGEYALDADELGSSRALHEGEIRYLDRVVGGFLAELEAAGRLDDALVIVTADHGEAFGEHGMVGHQFVLYDEILHVPLIVRAPQGARGARRADAVELLDLFGTILAATGTPLPDSAGARRRDLLAPAAPEPLVAEYYRPIEYLELIAQQYPRADASVWDRRLRSWREDGWKLVRSSRGGVELYHVDVDPGETRDLAGEEPARVAAMSAALELWQLEREGGTNEPATTPAVDEDFERALRSLGYVK